MNRQQIREQKRKKEPSVMYKQSDFEAIFEQTKRITTKLVINGLIAVFAMSLNDENGFGTKRINAVLDSTRRKYESIATKHLSLEDIEKWCAEKNIVLE